MKKLNNKCPMLAAKYEHNLDVIISKCLGFSSQECKFIAIFTFPKSVHAVLLYFSMQMHKNIV